MTEFQINLIHLHFENILISDQMTCGTSFKLVLIECVNKQILGNQVNLIINLI